MASIKLDDDSVRGLVAEAVLSSLSAEARNTLITDALKWLMTPREEANNRGYGTVKRPSPLEEAFRDAVNRAANQVVSEYLQNDPQTIENIKTLYAEAMHKLMTDGRIDTVNAIASAIGEGMSRAGRY